MTEPDLEGDYDNAHPDWLDGCAIFTLGVIIPLVSVVCVVAVVVIEFFL